MNLAFSLPLAHPKCSDEPCTAVWQGYAKEVAAAGTFSIMTKYFPQLRFGIETGMMTRPDYVKATRMGLFDAFTPAACPFLDAPAQVEVAIIESAAGRLPAVIAATRSDFEALVQAFTARNEPVPIAPSMGACLVTGVNNWHRMSLIRAEMVRQPEMVRQHETWSDKRKRQEHSPAAYQDSFVILSSGPYSGIASGVLGICHDDWLAASLKIRAEHECVHYLSRRWLGRRSYSIADEVIADFYAVRKIMGRVRAETLLHFFGLEDFPEHRSSGRLSNYLDERSKGKGERDAIQLQVFLAAQNLQELSTSVDVDAQALYMLLGLSLQDLANRTTMRDFTEAIHLFRERSRKAADDDVPNQRYYRNKQFTEKDVSL